MGTFIDCLDDLPARNDVDVIFFCEGPRLSRPFRLFGIHGIRAAGYDVVTVALEDSFPVQVLAVIAVVPHRELFPRCLPHVIETVLHDMGFQSDQIMPLPPLRNPGPPLQPMKLTHSRRPVPRGLKCSEIGRMLQAQITGHRQRSYLVGVLPGQERSTCRRADRIDGNAVRKGYAVCDPIDIRSSILASR